MRMVRHSAVCEKLKSAINVGKQSDASRILGVLRGEILTVLRSYMDVSADGVTAEVEQSGECGYRFTFTACADTLLAAGVTSEMQD